MKAKSYESILFVKALTIAKQEFHFGFKLEAYSSKVAIEIGCFDLNRKLRGYGLAYESKVTQLTDTT